jgi:hypothetical protein
MTKGLRRNFVEGGGRIHTSRRDDARPGDPVFRHHERDRGAGQEQHHIVSHSPAAVGELFRQMQDAIMIGQKGASISQRNALQFATAAEKAARDRAQ